MIYLLFLLCLSANVFAMDSIAPKQQSVKKEPIVRVDRYDVSLLQNDPAVLVSNSTKIKLNQAISPEPQVIKVQAEPVYVVRDEEPKITVTYEED